MFAEFDKLNPLHYVPVLVDGDVVISDSYAILLVGSLKLIWSSLIPNPDTVMNDSVVCVNLFAVWVVFGREVSSETPVAN